MKLLDLMIRCNIMGGWKGGPNHFTLARKSAVLDCLTVDKMRAEGDDLSPIMVHLDFVDLSKLGTDLQSISLTYPYNCVLTGFNDISDPKDRDADDWVWVEEFLDYLKGTGQVFNPTCGDVNKVTGPIARGSIGTKVADVKRRKKKVDLT
jgi:hypothetical protein